MGESIIGGINVSGYRLLARKGFPPAVLLSVLGVYTLVRSYISSERWLGGPIGFLSKGSRGSTQSVAWLAD